MQRCACLVVGFAVMGAAPWASAQIGALSWADKPTDTGVSLIGPLRVAIGKGLGSFSLTAETVSLVARSPLGLRPVAVRLAYAPATGQLEITPARALEPGTRYEIILNAVNGDAGKADVDAVLTFTTLHNSVVRKEFFRDGKPLQYQELSYDSAQRAATRSDFWFDEEGRAVLAERVRFGYQATRYYEGHFAAPGADGRWDTADDVMASYFLNELDDNGNVVLTMYGEGSGADGAWLSADDTARRVDLFAYDTNGRLWRETTLAAFGSDGLWGTRDDELSYYRQHDYDPSGNLLRTWHFDAAGPDGVWRTDDDRVAGVAVQLPDAAGQAYFDDAGRDGQWLTSDDRMQSYRLDRSEPGRLSYVYGKGPGTDGQWLTGDDGIDHVSVYATDDTAGHKLQVVYRGAGPDGVWLSGDDQPSEYTVYAYNTQGLATGFTRYSGAGRDGLWFNADDDIQQYEVYELVGNGARRSLENYSGPGVDGRWHTGDDELAFRYDYDVSR